MTPLLFFSESLAPGSVYLLSGLGIIIAPLETKIIPFTAIARASMYQDRATYNALLDANPRLCEVWRLSTQSLQQYESQIFVHKVVLAHNQLNNNSSILDVADFVPQENVSVIITPKDVLIDLSSVLNKSVNPLLLKDNSGNWRHFVINAFGETSYLPLTKLQNFVLNNIQDDKRVLIPTEHPIYGECRRLNLGDIFARDNDLKTISAQTECKTVYSTYKLSRTLRSTAATYIGLDVSVLDNENKTMYIKPAGVDIYALLNLNKNLDDEGLTKKLWNHTDEFNDDFAKGQKNQRIARQLSSNKLNNMANNSEYNNKYNE